MRAKARNDSRSLLKKLIQKAETGSGVLQEEAERMNAQIDSEILRDETLTATEAMGTVGERTEFGSATPEMIHEEEELRAISPELFEALKSHKYDVARSISWERSGELLKKGDSDGYRKFLSLSQNLKERQIGSAFSGGNVEAMESAANAGEASIEDFLTIPVSLAHTEEVKELISSRLEFAAGGYPGHPVEELPRILDKFVQKGLIEDEKGLRVKIGEELQERLVSDLARQQDVKTFPEILEKYSRTGLIGAIEDLPQLPKIKENLTNKLLYEVTSLDGSGWHSPGNGKKILEKYAASTNLLGSAEDLAQLPGVQQHYRNRLVHDITSGLGSGGWFSPEHGRQTLEEYAESGLLGSFEELRDLPIIRNHFNRLLIDQVGQLAWTPTNKEAVLEKIQEFESSGLSDSVETLRLENKSLDLSLRRVNI